MCSARHVRLGSLCSGGKRRKGFPAVSYATTAGPVGGSTPISQNLLSGRNLCRHLPRVRHLRNVREPLSLDLLLREVRYELSLSPALRTSLTTKPYRQQSPSHHHLRRFPRTNVSHAIIMDPSGRLSSVKNVASKPTRERLESLPSHWTWIIGCARSARTIKCKMHHWIRPVCFVPRSDTIPKTGFIHLRIHSCARKSLRKDRDGCTCSVQCSYRSSHSVIPRGYGWLRGLA